MARKEINVGTSPNKGDGDPLRTAFRKINDNFAELYTGNFAEPDAITSTLAPDTDGTYDLGKSDKRWTDLYVKDFIYLNGSRIELTSNGTLLINGGPPAERQDTVGSVFADDSTVMVDGIAGKVVGPVDTTTVDASIVTATNLNGLLTGNVVGNVTGDLKGSVYADDSTTIIDGVAGSINLDGTVKGNIIPDADEAYDIGSMTHKFRDLYLSGSTINLGGLEITNDNGVITFGGEKVVVEGGTGDVQGSVFADDSTLLVDAVNGTMFARTLTTPNLILDGDVTTLNELFIDGGGQAIGIKSQVNIVMDGDVLFQNGNITGLTGNLDGDLTGSVFGDDSTLLVDGVAGKIVGDIETDSFTVTGTGFVNLNNDAQGDTFYGGATTDKAILLLKGADYLAGSDNGGGIVIQGGAARNGGNNGDVIISSGSGGADGTGYISLLSNYITTSGTWIGTQTMDIKGSVFGDDSTLLVDGVAGKIVGNVDTSIVETNIVTSQGGNLNATGATLIVAAANGTAQGGPTLVGGAVGTAGNGGSTNLFGGPGNAGNGGNVFVSGGLGTGGDGGDVSVYAGNGSVNGGNTYIGSGNGGSGTDGSVIFTGLVDFSSATIDWVPIVSGVLVNNGLPTLPTQTLDISGSVFGDDSTLLVDGVNGTIPAANLTGVMPALDGSNLTGVTTGFSNITSTPTTLAGYGITDAATLASPAFTGTVDFSSADVTGAGFTFNQPVGGGSTELGFDADTIDFGDGKTIDMQNSSVLFGGSTVKTPGIKSVDVQSEITLADEGGAGIRIENQTTTSDPITIAGSGDVSINSLNGEVLIETDMNGLHRIFMNTGKLTLQQDYIRVITYPPSSSKGAAGDEFGMFAFGSGYIYYCTTSYTDGVADIWKRVAWSADTW